MKDISVAPGFYKCFDELLVNSHDHKQRMKKIAKDESNHHLVTTIKVNINEDASISFYNDGDGILIEYMEEHKMYPPELIFGSLLTSTNYGEREGWAQWLWCKLATSSLINLSKLFVILI